MPRRTRGEIQAERDARAADQINRDWNSGLNPGAVETAEDNEADNRS